MNFGYKSIIAVTLALFVLLTLANEYMFSLEREHLYDQSKRELISETALLRASIEREISTTLSLAMGLVVYVSTHPDLDQKEFASVAQTLMRNAPNIRNIGLAKGTVISHIYPLEGNEAALGLRYLDHSEQRAAVVRAIEETKTVIAGPVSLVQGGEGFISRIPVYIGEGYRSYWGIASVVIDVETFYRDAGLDRVPHLNVALRGKDALGASGALFYGDENLFKRPDAVTMPIKLPVGSWQLAVAYADGHEESVIIPYGLRVMGYLGVLLITLLLYQLLNAIRLNRFQALHDPLTGLANRRLFNVILEQAMAAAERRNNPFALLYVDLDRFKPINDTYGHDAGDTVLCGVAQRLQKVSRAADHIARIGGDEFVIILHDVGSMENAENVAEKIARTLNAPIAVSELISVRPECSIGISLYPGDGRTADELINHADHVMYRKKSGKKEPHR